MLMIAILMVLMVKAVFGSSVSDWRRDIIRGDIILIVNAWIPAWWQGWGLYDVGHTALYVGTMSVNGRVWYEQTVEASPAAGRVTHYHVSVWDDPRYTVFLLRPPVVENIKRRAVDIAIGQVGKPYSYNYFNTYPYLDNDSWYCTELVWSAYLLAGHELFPIARYQSDSRYYIGIRPTWFFDAFGTTNQVDAHRESDPVPQDAYGVINTNSLRSFLSIGEALDDAQAGDTIVVIKPAARENLIITKQNIILRSEVQGGTYLYAAVSDQSVIKVRGAQNVTLDGFNIVNNLGSPSSSNYTNGSGVFFSDGSDGGTLLDLIVLNNKSGVGFDHSSGAVVARCFFERNERGLGFLFSDGNYIFRNTFKNNRELDVTLLHYYPSYCSVAQVFDEYASEPDRTAEAVRQFRDESVSEEIAGSYNVASSALKKLLAAQPELKMKAWKIFLRFGPRLLNKNKALVEAEEAAEVKEFLAAVRLAAMARLDFPELEDVSALLDKLEAAAGAAVGKSFAEAAGGTNKLQDSTDWGQSYFFLNDTLNQSEASADRDMVWFSPWRMRYLYRRYYTSEGYLGNYWGRLEFSDADRNGVYDSAKLSDYYPLVMPNRFYYFLNWV